MSDRASNMKAFNKAFQDYKQERLGPHDDASTLFLFCNAHFLLGLSTAAEKICKEVEELESEPGTSFDAPFLFFDQQSSMALIRCAADLFGPRGDKKHGSRQQWLAYCSKNKLKSLFCSFRSNRFNNVFENACALIAHKDHIVDFVDNFCSHSRVTRSSSVSKMLLLTKSFLLSFWH